MKRFCKKAKPKNHLAFIILLHQEHKWKMFIEIDGEEKVLLLVKVRSYTHREKSNPTNAVFLSRYMMCHLPGLKRPHSSLFFSRYSVRAMRVLREERQSRSSDWLFYIVVLRNPR